MVTKCKKCGLTIRQFKVAERGHIRTAWFSLIKGTWSEACVTSFLFRKRHVPV